MAATLGPMLLGSGQGPPRLLLIVPGQTLTGPELQVGDRPLGCVKGCPHSQAPWVLAPPAMPGAAPTAVSNGARLPGVFPKMGPGHSGRQQPCGLP